MVKNHKGFAAVEVLLLLVFVGIISGSGWYVYQKRNDKEATMPQTQDAHKIQTTVCGEDWTVISHNRVSLPKWHVEMTIPDGTVGNATCKYDKDGNDTYYISTLEASTEACSQHGRMIAVSEPAIYLYRYSADASALGNLTIDDNDKRTFGQYYEENQLDGTNYVEYNGDEYYKVADGFYNQAGSEFFDSVGQDIDKFTPGVQPYEIDAVDLAKNCPNLKPGFLNQFGDLAKTIQPVVE